jgi:hypothetical protein
MWKRAFRINIAAMQHKLLRVVFSSLGQISSKFKALFCTPHKAPEFLTNRVFPFDLQAIFP